jgi:hypothetical protein
MQQGRNHLCSTANLLPHGCCILQTGSVRTGAHLARNRIAVMLLNYQWVAILDIKAKTVAKALSSQSKAALQEHSGYPLSCLYCAPMGTYTASPTWSAHSNPCRQNWSLVSRRLIMWVFPGRLWMWKALHYLRGHSLCNFPSEAVGCQHSHYVIRNKSKNTAGENLQERSLVSGWNKYLKINL